MKFWLAIALNLILVPCPSVFAADGFQISYLGDHGLTAWSVENNCEVEFDNGELLLKSGDGWLRSHHTYRDFHMHLEWKALKEAKYDAGIYIRAQKPGAPFPKQAYQINLLDGKEGHIGNLPGATTEGLIRNGDWNAFDITVRGETVALKVNGKSAYRVDGLKIPEGYIGIQIEVPNGGQFRFRNIHVTEFGFESLLEKNELAHWEGAGQPPEACWELTDGILTCVKPKGPWLRSKLEYGDFNLRLQYRVQLGGNSGVYVRVPHDGNHHRDKDSQPPAGFEVQILDDTAKRYRNLKDYQFSASVYDIAGASPRVCRPHGEWNTLEIDCQGSTVRTIHNGVEVVHVTPETHPAIQLRQTRGYLGLQNHGVGVSFRDLRIQAD